MSITIKQDAFEGPLDLLLHLIEKNKMDVYDIQIAPITNQYMEYIEEMEQSKQISLEGMSEFIVMAATLLYIKSKMLLPKTKVEDETEEDPRQELVIRLLEYKKMKYISEELKQYEIDAEEVFYRNSPLNSADYIPATIPVEKVLEGITFQQIYQVFEDMMKRKKDAQENKIDIDYNIIKRDSYTVKEKSRYILDLIKLKDTISFYDIFQVHTPKIEMVVTFMAILELVHKKKIKIYQKKMLSNIWISGVIANE